MSENAPKDGHWFASVGGNPTEIIRVSDAKWYSFGCSDPHELDGSVELIRRLDDTVAFPLPKAEREAQAAKWARSGNRQCGYRTFPAASMNKAGTER